MPAIVYVKSRTTGRQHGKGLAAKSVADLDRETAQLAEKGVPAVLSGNPRNGGTFATFDTGKVGDMMVKLVPA